MTQRRTVEQHRQVIEALVPDVDTVRVPLDQARRRG
jgi:hypothetical protein